MDRPGLVTNLVRIDMKSRDRNEHRPPCGLVKKIVFGMVKLPAERKRGGEALGFGCDG